MARDKRDGTLMSVAEHVALAKAPRLAKATDIAGKIWNAPNTALGLIAGGVGYAAGQVDRLRHPDRDPPRVQVGHNAVEFINNPVSPLGGLTLGNVTMYGDDPYDPSNKGWAGYRRKYGHPVQEHEEQHTYQGQQLGPFYLPSNIAGGLLALARDRDWGGPSNWNERGPKLNPPRPWAGRKDP